MIYYIGVDVGTGSVRAALVSSTGGIIITSTREIKISTPQLDFFMQSSNNIWEVVKFVVQEVMKTSGVKKDDVHGIGFDATCSLVVLKKNGDPVSVCPSGDPEYNIVMWLDHRAKQQADLINSQRSDLLRSVGGRISPEMEPPKLMWLKQNLPDSWREAAHFLELPDFLTYKATGVLSRSLCNLVSKWLFQADGSGKKEWNKSFMESIGLDDLLANNAEKIGNVVLSPGEPCGNGLTEKAAEELGLNIGTPVGTSILDAHSGVLGCIGCLPSSTEFPLPEMGRRMVLVCGTSSCHMVVNKKAIFVPGVWGPFYSSILPNMWSGEGGQSASGKLIDFVVETHPAYGEAKEKAKEKDKHVHDVLNQTLQDLAKSKGLDSVSRLTQNFHIWPDFHGNRSPVADPDLTGMSNPTMPRKKYWRRGEKSKKGDSHPSKHSLTIDMDMGTPPIQKMEPSENDMGTPPIQKKELRDSTSDYMGTPPIKKKELWDCLGTRPPNAPNLRNEPSYHKDLRNEQSYHKDLANEQSCNKDLGNEPSSNVLGNEPSFYNDFRNDAGCFIFASHAQSDTRYSNFSRGSQCTCMSLSMIFSLVENMQFSPTVLDQVLHLGDNLYRKIVLDLKNAGQYKSNLLSFDEIPTAVEYRDSFYRVNKRTTVCGLPVIMSPSSEALSLHEGILLALSKSQYLLVMVGAICSAIAKKGNDYCFFDSHSHGSDGLSSPDGKAVLIRFSKLDDLVAFLYSYYISCNIDLSSQYEILPVNVELIRHNFLGFLPLQTLPENTIKKQKMSNIGNQNSNSKTLPGSTFLQTDEVKNRQNYMRKYMHSKRINVEFRDKERQKEMLSKRMARDNEQYRCKELQGKRKARHNEQYRCKERQKELMGKRKARDDEQFRERELLSKHKARSDEQYRDKERQKELMGKRKARDDEQFQDKELLSKRKCRSDEQYRDKERQKELMGKRKARDDEQFREKELLSKHKARSDEQYRDKERQKELLGKRKARDDEQFREKELLSKRKCRSDEQYRDKERQKELMGKRKARDDEQFREKELVSRRKCRSDEQYRDKERQKELLGKRKARDDEQFRKKELLSKRKCRSDEQYRDKERQKELLGKRKARDDEQFRKKELLSKRKARSHEQYRGNEKQKEMLGKRKARLNTQFKLKERMKGLQSKRRARKNTFFVESERLKKQQVRISAKKDNRDKERKSDKNRKILKRKSEHFFEKERDFLKKKKYGQTIEECTERFHSTTSTGPLYICTCCHQTWFFESVTKVESIVSSVVFQPGILTGVKSVQDKEWICRTCLSNIKKNRIPKLSVLNGMEWPYKPVELNLHPLEERLISLRIPFMQIRELPRGGQYCVKGNVINVPVDIQPTINALPRQMDENFTIPVKLKKKLTYKKCDFTENVRPAAVLSALHWLLSRSELYKNSGVAVDRTWEDTVRNDSREIVREFLCNASRSQDSVNVENEELHVYSCNSNEHVCTEEIGPRAENNSTLPIGETVDKAYESDNFSEVDAADNVIGNADTLLEDVSLNTDRSYTFAPGEGQHPLSLYTDQDAEFLSFPSIFCGQKRPENKDRKVPVHYSDIAKWELRSQDRRAAQSVPNIFFKLKKIQLKQISDKVHLAVRRVKTKGKKITAAEARDQSTLDRIVRLDEGYYIFKQLRNSPSYLASRKKDLFAMIRQLGLPTWFMSLSSADTRWLELLKTLAKLNDNEVLSDRDIEEMSWNQKSKLVQKDPVTCSRFFDHRVQQFINVFLKSQHNPIGTITDYFYRVEFQQRGSPHIHMLVWINNAPKYSKDPENKIVEFVEKFVTCSSTDDSMNPQLSLQIHKHSKTCRKKGKAICRFGFPLPPLKQTMILEPLDTDVDKYKKMYDQIQQKVNNFKEGLSLSYEQFLGEVAGIPEEEYIKCIRSSLSGPKLLLRREPSEMRVNMYNEHLLRTWNANIDLQFVLDPFACAMYIVSYISKSQRGMSALLDRACKEARKGNMDIKQQVRHIGNQFLNSVEVSAQEACYLVLQMPLTKASRDVVFINTSPPDERVLLLKQQSKLEELSPDSTDIHCQNIIKRYSLRPRQLENWCLADYASQLEIKYPEDSDNNDFQEENDDDPNHDEMENDNTDFTPDDTLVKLKNGIIIRKRLHDLILRYVHYSLKNDPENHYREKMLLFMPWRNESTDLLGEFLCYKDHYKHKQYMIENKAKLYEKNFEEITQAMQTAQEEFDQHDELAPSAQQTNAEEENEQPQESEQYVHFNPDRPIEHRHYDIGADLGAATSNSAVNYYSERIPDEEYLQLLRSLNLKQREFFCHVVHWIKTKDVPLYAFLCGGAGVGKSVVIKAIYQALHRQLHSIEGEDPDDTRILLCAFTGKAAYNINGVTIASAFRKKYNQLNQAMSSDELNTFRMKYRNLSVIIIDEISMVGNKMLNFINTRLKELTATNRPFGGISIIAVGDLYQLQPVGDNWIFNDLSDGPEILANNLWKEHFTMFELTQIMRQRDDISFAGLLNRLRTNDLTKEDRAVIQDHMVNPGDENYPKEVPHLFIENKFVDSFNQEFISKLSTDKVTVDSHDAVVADIPRKNKERLLSCLPKDASKTANLPHSLMLAVGMIYEITVNLDVNDGLANGTTCIVKCIECRMPQTTRPSIVWVLFNDNKIGTSTRQKYHHLYRARIDASWTPIFDVNRNFMYNYKAYQRTQFPLKPAAAKTVHKAQGCTVDKLVIDLSQTRTRKTPHIHYVAMSRVRKLKNLKIVNFNDAALTVDERVKKEMERLRETAMMTLCFMPLYNIDSCKFKLALNNARSLHKHIHDVSREPNILAANVIGITESRLCIADEDEKYSIEGFVLIRNDHDTSNLTSRPYHGLAMYIKLDSECSRVIKHSTNTFEFLLCDLKDSAKDFVQVALVYKSPACTFSEFKAQTVNYLCPHLDSGKPFIIMGDFNFDISSGYSEFIRFMENTLKGKQYVQKSSTNNGSLLDLIFSNVPTMCTEVVECYWSDHKIVTAYV